MRVRELADLLAQHMAEGRGEDTVYVVLSHDGVLDDVEARKVDRLDWEVTETSWSDDRDRFYVLSAEPESAEHP